MYTYSNVEAGSYTHSEDDINVKGTHITITSTLKIYKSFVVLSYSSILIDDLNL